MKTIYRHAFGFIPAVLTAILAGCSSDTPDDIISVEPGEPQELKISASLPDQTRVTGTSWAQNDEIGIFVNHGSYDIWSSTWDYSNLRFKAKSSGAATDFVTFDPNAKVKLAYGEKYQIRAYYPYTSANNTWNLRTDFKDQRTGNFDILVAEELVTDPRNVCNLTFEHLFSRLIFVFKPGKDVTLDQIKKMSIKIVDRIYNSGLIGTSFKEDKDYYTVANGDMLENWEISTYGKRQENANDLTITVFLLPQGNKTLTLSGVLAGDKGTFSCSFLATLTRGKTQTLNITVNKYDFTIESVTCNDWKLEEHVGNNFNNDKWWERV